MLHHSGSAGYKCVRYCCDGKKEQKGNASVAHWVGDQDVERDGDGLQEVGERGSRTSWRSGLVLQQIGMLREGVVAAKQAWVGQSMQRGVRIGR